MSSAECVVVEGAHKIWKRPNTPFYSNAIKLSEICDDSFRGKVSQVAQDSEVSQVPRMIC